MVWSANVRASPSGSGQILPQMSSTGGITLIWMLISHFILSPRETQRYLKSLTRGSNSNPTWQGQSTVLWWSTKASDFEVVTLFLTTSQSAAKFCDRDHGPAKPAQLHHQQKAAILRKPNIHTFSNPQLYLKILSIKIRSRIIVQMYLPLDTLRDTALSPLWNSHEPSAIPRKLVSGGTYCTELNDGLVTR